MFIYIYAAVSNGIQKTEAQAIFLNSFYRLLVRQTEVCRLPVTKKQTEVNKQKLSDCNELNSRRTCPSMPASIILARCQAKNAGLPC
jgi:hypothetical protein